MNKKGNPSSLSNAGMGRPKGAKNKFTALKEGFLKAFEDIGGVKELVVWGKKPQNKGEFYKMITKLFPKEVELSGADGEPLIPHLLVLPEIDGAQKETKLKAKPKKKK